MQKNLIAKNILAFFLLMIFVLAPSFVLAAADKWGLPDKPAGIPDTELSGIVARITDYVLGFVTIIAVLMLIWGGIKYLTAAGDEGATEEAKGIITQAVIGLIIVGISYSIVVVVVNYFIGGV